MTARKNDDVDLATDAARLGAEILLKHWEQLGKEDADLKSRNDWVSRADRESEAAIVSFIRQHCPDDAILGEEGGISAEGTSGRTWIIDPLDGTSNYLQHFPVWSISIGVKTGDEITAAVVHEPLRDIFFTATRGGGAFRDGQPMHVSNQRTLDSSFLATGFPFRAQQFVSVYCAIFQEVIRVAKGVRRAGSAALDLAYTAAGIFDGFFELHLSPWDIAAGSLLVTEAGGVFTDFSGGQRWLQRGNVVGAPPGVHADLLRLLSRHVSEDQLDRRATGRALPSQ
jgi:myo-inositol-1(or 4)-monophosphatase